MRLIDADEFAVEEPKLWDWSSVDGISSTAVLKQCIWDVQCAPRVEAIPKEWIRRYTRCEISVNDYWAIVRMFKEWEKENDNQERPL